MAKGRQIYSDRARKTLYVTGFNSKLTTKQLLLELFNQGGPVTDITLFETHAYVLFQHEESVPYCLALFSDIELHGNKLRISPRTRARDTYSFVDYLTRVRNKIRDDYLYLEPPNLPPKVYTNSRSNSNAVKTRSSKKGKKEKPKKGKRQPKNNHKSKGRVGNHQTTHSRAKKSGNMTKNAGNQKKVNHFRTKINL